jgi:hypothetical protein
MTRGIDKLALTTLVLILGWCGLAQNWQTVDDFTYGPGGAGNARAVVVSASGDVYVAGAGGPAGLDHAILRAAREDQLAWTTLDDFVYRGMSTMFSAVHVTQSGIIFTAAAATATNGPLNGHWLIRRSTDRGATWQTVDDVAAPGGAFIPFSLTSNPEGTLFALGLSVGGPDFWLLRVSHDAGQTWYTTNSLSIAGGPRQIISAGSDLFAVGTEDDGSGIQQWTVQKSSDVAGSWETSDLFQYSWRSFANGIAADVAGNLYVVGLGQYYAGPTDWIVRRGTRGDLNWATTDAFESGTLQGPNNRASASAVAVSEADGNVYVTGSANFVPADAVNGPSHLTTRQLSSSTGEWMITDDFLPPGSSSAQGNSIAVGPSGNVFVAGRVVLTNSHWIVRKLTGVAPQTPPRLQISAAANLVSVSWPTSATNYILETSSNLGTLNNWTPVSDTPQIVGEQFMLTFGATNSAQYFRLTR